MLSAYTDQVIGIVPEAKIADVNTDAAAWDPDTGGANTLGDKLGLSADGSTPSTHRAFCQQVTPAILASMQASATANSWNLYKASDGHTWTSILTTEGLQVIPPPA